MITQDFRIKLNGKTMARVIYDTGEVTSAWYWQTGSFYAEMNGPFDTREDAEVAAWDHIGSNVRYPS